jgi:hypothetical protein
MSADHIKVGEAGPRSWQSNRDASGMWSPDAAETMRPRSMPDA